MGGSPNPPAPPLQDGVLSASFTVVVAGSSSSFSADALRENAGAQDLLAGGAAGAVGERVAGSPSATSVTATITSITDVARRRRALAAAGRSVNVGLLVTLELSDASAANRSAVMTSVGGWR